MGLRGKESAAKHQAEIIVAAGNFHGRTTTIISFSTEPSYRDDFGPFTPGFIAVPYGDAAALEKAITPNTAAFLVEPIQGEGGVIIPPAGYLKQVAEICKKNNVLLIADEIQTGLGRTGKLFASEHEDVRPDMVIIGKALGGRVLPRFCRSGRRVHPWAVHPGRARLDLWWQPLAAAVARAALTVLVEENWSKIPPSMGEYFMEQLAEIPSPWVKEVRGRGLLIGVELKTEAGGARRFCEA